MRCFGFLRGVPGFLGDLLVFFLGGGDVPGIGGVPGSSRMFRCSGVPGSTTCPWTKLTAKLLYYSYFSITVSEMELRGKMYTGDVCYMN